MCVICVIIKTMNDGVFINKITFYDNGECH